MYMPIISKNHPNTFFNCGPDTRFEKLAPINIPTIDKTLKIASKTQSISMSLFPKSPVKPIRKLLPSSFISIIVIAEPKMWPAS